MTEALSRAFVADIQIRADGDGRTVSGIVVPFDQVARVSDGGPSYDEAFQRGSFTQTIRQLNGNYSRVKLLSQHESRRNPLGRATMLREDGAGVYGEFGVSKTQAGDEALELVRDGSLDSFSVGFAPVKHVKREHVTWRTEVALREASLVTFPAYAGALIQSVRDWDGLTDEQREEALAWLRNQATELPATEQVGTSDEGAPVDEPAEGPLRSTPQQKLAFKRALIERGFK